MHTINNIIGSFIATIATFAFLIIICAIFAPNLVPGVSAVFGLLWLIFKSFFAGDVIKTLIMALCIFVVFGAISKRKENIMIAFIGVIIGVVILYAGFGGK